MYNFDLSQAEPCGGCGKAAVGQQRERRPLGGGQTLIPTMKQRLASPLEAGFADRDCGDAGCVLGRWRAELLVGRRRMRWWRREAGAYPALAELAAHIGDPAVRNRGTIGGAWRTTTRRPVTRRRLWARGRRW